MLATESVIKIVQELLSDEAKEAISPALVNEKIDMVLQMNPKWRSDMDRDAAVAELIRRFSIWIGQDTTLKSTAGHTDWLNAARKKDWRYWQRYREWSERRLPESAMEALDRSTDTILGLLEDPLREGSWDRRGLVVGHVQSGKTGNYTGLIAKAADAGYKIIIVLAGLHNNLRSQTQMRLDEGFLGYETRPSEDDLRIIGVGEIDTDPAIRPNYVTNRTNAGDFNTTIANKLGITPEQRPWLFVVKKNKTVLERLHKWIRNRVADSQDSATGRKIVTNLPLLVIDDEADHASVDTGEQVFGDNGQPDEEHSPTAINRLIRRILHSFAKSAYVGYTATPFANIFIHERGTTRDEGPDLFPAAFIINLGAPSNYVGPIQVFGLQSAEGRRDGLPLVRSVDDYLDRESVTGWMPPSHKNGHRPHFAGTNELPPSLKEAINSFLLATCVRYLRGQRDQHSSMLIHVTRFNSVQQEVLSQVAEYVRRLKQRLVRAIDSEEIELVLENLWQKDFVPTGDAVRANGHPETPDYPQWSEIREMLPDVCSDVEVRMINGTAKDALDYSENSSKGLKVIAIGGDKLSRGLTLEGLTTSYFLRASKMYDTLMQMGRWFGYRPGYLDLCRLYTTAELQEWFGHIADAAEELREEFELMAASGATPREYGLKVQSHPVLLVTSRLKMRTAKSLMLSFSGSTVETVVFLRNQENLRGNLDATQNLLTSLKDPVVNPALARGEARQILTGTVWNNVPGALIADFFAGYRTHRDAHKINSALLAEFVRKMMESGELTSWTVALIGSRAGKPTEIAPGIATQMIERSAKSAQADRYSIGRLLSPRDEAIDLDETAWNAALELTRTTRRNSAGQSANPEEIDIPSGPCIRIVRGFGAEGVPPHPERGLLLLYALDPAEAGDGLFPKDSLPIMGFGASFPASHSGTKVEYKVNNVLWEQEYGAAD